MTTDTAARPYIGTEEVWKEATGYPGYMVSSHGRVKSLKWGKERILTPLLRKDGYQQVNLTDANGRQAKHYVHRLVALAFWPWIQENTRVVVTMHDGDRSNSRLENLRWSEMRTPPQRLVKRNELGPAEDRGATVISLGKGYQVQVWTETNVEGECIWVYIRIFRLNPKGEWYPTRFGFRLRPRAAVDLASAIVERPEVG